MSTKDLKFMVEKLELLVENRELMETPEDYTVKKEEILSAIVKQAEAMRAHNRVFPDRHKEDFVERQALVDSNTVNVLETCPNNLSNLSKHNLQY